MTLVIERVDPWKFTFTDAIALVEAQRCGFVDDPLARYVYAKELQFDFDIFSLRKSIADPRERLAKFVRQAKDYDYCMKHEARSMWQLLLGKDIVAYATYEVDEESGNKQMVGCAIWKIPGYMVPEVQLHSGILWNLYRWTKSLQLRIVNAFARGFREPPFLNSRLFQFAADRDAEIISQRKSAAELSTMSREKLEDAVYPVDYMHYLMIYCVTLDNQRKGIGGKMLDYCLKSLPTTEPVFRCGTNSATGPLRYYLEATDKGRGLYAKYGFKPVYRYVGDYAGIEIASTIMIKRS
ncbi:hypothetical protein TRVA0_054S00122 [Trichomonascus vanleenenianus]|uniref:uncharacterized protein n=1 Tax=Trichomonascus vanleenenianus TaxID=2268995 RepID=UPI003ECABA81